MPKTLQNFGVPCGDAITPLAEPQKAHRFLVLPSGGTDADRETFRKAVVTVEVDFVEKMASILLREDVGGSVTRAILGLMQYTNTLDIEFLSGCGTSEFTLSVDGKVVEHKVVFSYTDPGNLHHRLVWKIKELRAS
jgi:hypothetical protein